MDQKDENYQTYQIALSDDLGITPEEFAQAWNEDADAHDLATAHFSEEKVSAFIDPTLLSALLSVPAGVATATIYDLIKGVIARLRKEKGQAQMAVSSTTPSPGSPSHIRIRETKKPDGTVIAVIDIYNR